MGRKKNLRNPSDPICLVILEKLKTSIWSSFGLSKLSKSRINTDRTWSSSGRFSHIKSYRLWVFCWTLTILVGCRLFWHSKCCQLPQLWRQKGIAATSLWKVWRSHAMNFQLSSLMPHQKRPKPQLGNWNNKKIGQTRIHGVCSERLWVPNWMDALKWELPNVIIEKIKETCAEKTSFLIFSEGFKRIEVCLFGRTCNTKNIKKSGSGVWSVRDSKGGPVLLMTWSPCATQEKLQDFSHEFVWCYGPKLRSHFMKSDCEGPLMLSADVFLIQAI